MTLHIYRCENPVRTRAKCPYHKHLCYGERQDFYDTSRIFFDCGTMVDYGYGEYTPPTLYKRLVIYWEGTGYTVSARYADKFLARQVSLSRARHIAKLRLTKDGKIEEKEKE